MWKLWDTISMSMSIEQIAITGVSKVLVPQEPLSGSLDGQCKITSNFISKEFTAPQ